jgi:PAS domain S-box-containing protein
MRQTKSRPVDVNRKFRRQLPALKSDIHGFSDATVPSAGGTAHEVDGNSQNLAERYDLALWATNTAFWDWDVENKLLWNSQGNQLLFGRDDEEITEKFDIEDECIPWASHLHPEDRTRAIRCVRDHLENDTPFDLEYRYLRPCGEYIWIRSVGRAVRSTDGRPLRMVGSNSDISERKLAEIEIRQFREAVDNASEGFVLYDADERFVYANKQYRKLFPQLAHLLKPGAHRGKLRQAFYSSGEVIDAVGRVDEFIDDLRHRQLTGGTSELEQANGVWIKYSDHVLPDGGIVSIRSDITEIKRREHELRESGLRLSEAQHLAHIGDWEWILETGKFYWSDECYRVFGYEAGSINPTFQTFEDLLHPDDREETLKAVDGALNKIRPYHQEYRIVWHNGEVRNIHAIGKVRFSDSGKPIRMLGTVQDITDRVSAEKARREAEIRLSSILENAPISITSKDPMGRYTYANPKWLNMYGLETDQIRDKTVHDLFPKYADLISAQDREVVKNQSAVEFEYVEDQADGEKSFLVKKFPVLDTDRRVTSIINMEIDITDRKLAEVELRESEERYRTVADLGQELIWIHTDGIIVYCNKYAAQALGLKSPEEMIGRPIFSFLHPDEHEHAVRRIPDMLTEKRDAPRREVQLLRSDGTVMITEFAGRPFTYRGKLSVLAIGRDITERKQSEDALRESEARLNEAQRIAHIGSWEINEKIGKLTWSDEVYRIFGVLKEAFQPTFDGFMECVHPDDRAIVSKAIETEAEGIKDYTYVHRIVRPDGEVRTVRQVALVHASEGGLTIRRAGTVQDITEQVNTEEHLHQAQKMEAVGQLTGGVAHDFNNLLTVMLGNLELIRDSVDADKTVSAMIDRGVMAAERGAALTDRLLAFSRKQTLLPITIDLNGLVVGMTDMLRRTLGETIEIHTKEAIDLWLCLADKSQLENALLNLAINARDAMSDGGSLTIETANISLDDEFAAAQAEVEPGEYVMLGVSDTGSGIAEETLKHVFEPFFTTKEVGKGTGLGLSMVYGFAKQSGGNLTIYSELDEGTTIKLYLPRSVAQSDDAVLNKMTSDISLAQEGERILIVEDDADVRMLAVALLSGLGYEIAEAGSAEAALDILKHTAPIDLLLSDVVLPGAMNGPDLAAEVRRHSQTTKILYMTGYAKEAFNNIAGLDERMHVIQKPFKKADLANKVMSVLDEE